VRIKSGFEHVAMFETTKFSQRHLRPRCSHQLRRDGAADARRSAKAEGLSGRIWRFRRGNRRVGTNSDRRRPATWRMRSPRPAATMFLPFVNKTRQAQTFFATIEHNHWGYENVGNYLDSGAAHDFRGGLYRPTADKRSSDHAKGELRPAFGAASLPKIASSKPGIFRNDQSPPPFPQGMKVCEAHHECVTGR